MHQGASDSLLLDAAIGERFLGLLADNGLRSHQRSAAPMSRALCEQTSMASFSETTHCQLLCFASHFMIAESLGLRLKSPHIQ
ncbi:hypothetical protein KP509_1Z012900 [Ceratopteris richardii]|nr:hypothetical protein KP509_1Z012900 [Ceratopteris richardii]